MRRDQDVTEAIKELTRLGVDEAKAEFMVAIERGEIDGDVTTREGRLTEAQLQRAGLGRRITDEDDE